MKGNTFSTDTEAAVAPIKLPKLWQKTYDARSKAELNDAYREWAQTYDDDR